MMKLNQRTIELMVEDAPTWDEIIDVSEVICITGMKRHGKSALTYYLGDYLAELYKKPIYTWGIKIKKRFYFPPYINHFNDINNVADYYNCIIEFDEFHRFFSSRSAMSKVNRKFTDLLTFSGQNNQILLLATLNNGLIDINTFRICNPVLIYKRVGYLQANSERRCTKKFTLDAAEKWKNIPRGRKGSPERAMESQLSYVVSDAYIGWMVNPLTTWWSENASEMHANDNGKYTKWYNNMSDKYGDKVIDNVGLAEINKEHPLREFK